MILSNSKRAVLSPWGLCGLSVLLGVALRLSLGLGTPVTLESDFQNHYDAAVALTEGRLSSYLVYKGLSTAPWTALGFLVLGGHEYVHWFLWNCLVLYPLTAIVMFLAAVEVVCFRRLATLAPLMLALLPSYVHVSRLVATENVLLLGVALTMWGFLRSLRLGTFSAAAIGGLCLAVGLHIKALFLLVIPFLTVAYFVSGTLSFPFLRILPGPRGRNILRAVLYAGVAAIVVLPWSVYLYRQLGRPVAMAAYGERIAYSYNSPYGDLYWPIALDRAPDLIPDFDPSLHRYDFSQYGDYAKWYLRHHPQSILRDLPTNFAVEFRYTGKVAKWVYRNTPGGLRSYRTEGLERGIFHLFLALGGLGFIAAGGARSRAAGATIRLCTLYGLAFVPFVLAGGQERHRMAFMPLVILLSTMYLSAALRRGGVRGLVTAPLAGATSALYACGVMVRELFSAPVRFPKTTAIVLVAALATWAVARRFAPIRLAPEDLVDGSVAVVREGPLADPNAVLGLEDPGSSTYEAVFELSVPKGGAYEMRATYACATPWPLTVSVNGAPVLHGVFGESFGGAYNTFAHRRQIGRLVLRKGENTLVLHGAAEDRGSDGSEIGDPLHFDYSDLATRIGRGTEVVESTSDRLIMRLHEVALGDGTTLETPILRLSEPLMPGRVYSVHLPMTRDEGVFVKLRLYTIDEHGKYVPGRTHQERLTAVMPDLVIRRIVKPITTVKLRLDAWGGGRLELGGTPRIREGFRSPGAEYPGPFIEEIVLVPVTGADRAP